jgi:catechol 2,3-dioxygenase-like lactoylglutathione lyase family enzyme
MIDHANIVVSDIERSVNFYTRLLGLRRGFERMLEGPWIDSLTGISGVRAQCVFLEGDGENGGGARLELLQFLSPDSLTLQEHGAPHALGLRHVAFAVADVDEVLARGREVGLEVVGGPVTVPFAVGNLGRKRLCYARDPDGVLIEIASYERSA